MYSPKVEVVWRTFSPAGVVSNIAKQATMADPDLTSQPSSKLIEFCYKAKHRSVFEHVSLSLRLTGISRNLLAQIRTHRHASFISSSQHYQDYRDYGNVQPDLRNYSEAFRLHTERGKELYAIMVDNGEEIPEARYVLPSSSEVNLIITANAREWAHIINLRYCGRNVKEMVAVAKAIRAVLIDWFPELFRLVGPDCFETGRCLQGKMCCGKQAYFDGTVCEHEGL